MFGVLAPPRSASGEVSALQQRVLGVVLQTHVSRQREVKAVKEAAALLALCRGDGVDSGCFGNNFNDEPDALGVSAIGSHACFCEQAFKRR